jgi:phosphomannomutase
MPSQMPPKFGTSGLRGLVHDLTPDLVRRYTQAYLAACRTGDAVQVGWDLRPSSPDIADAVIGAIQAAGQRFEVLHPGGRDPEDGRGPHPGRAGGAADRGLSAQLGGA